ncbi:MAG: NCS2 family permease [Candidatus Omnitrophica bacterium]|nr:NCS2 family permease [Candidatus Omnitrophota bacterium]
MLNRLFKLKQTGTNIRTEIIGGITTFMTMSYIIFVQPAVLSQAGMDFGAVMLATCLASALATILMAFLANYPIALAPAMGHNFYFVFGICLALGVPWQVALGANFISGFVFVILALFGLRAMLLNAVPSSLKNAIAVGIGLLIALIGFEWSGIVVANPGTLIGLGNLRSQPVILSILGIIIISIMIVKKIKGAILIGIIISAFIGWLMGIVKFAGLVSLPPSINPTLFKLDISSALTLKILPVIFILFFLDLFDTVGTLIGVGQEGGFIKEGKLPRARRALLSDALGTVAGTCLGTSTVTSYIESATGISQGARTGLSNLVTALLFLLSIFFFPVVKMIGGGYATEAGLTLYPIIAPALIIVGCIMLKNVVKVQWNDYTEAIPCFLTLTTMAFTFSITEGIAFGFISYAFLKLVSGRFKEVHWIIYLFAFLFLLRYIFLK